MDWEQLLAKWIVLFELTAEERKELYESLHIPVQKSLNVVSQSAQKKALSFIEDEKNKDIKEWLVATFILQTWGGYMLYLIEHHIDPVELNISKNIHAPAIDELWVGEYEKNQCHDYIQNIQPIISLFLDKATSIRLEQFLLHFSSFYAKEYRTVANIRNCLGWALV